MEIRKNTIKLINEHIDNIIQLSRALDCTEKKFKEQLLEERTYFEKVRMYVQKGKEIPPILIVILENKLKHYKKTNKYRYELARNIVDYNNYKIEEIANIPF